jgi:hypothetical protein
MRNTGIFIGILISSLVLSMTDVTAGDEIFRWVDENGVVHFGDRADAPDAAELVEIRKTPETTQPAVDPALTEPAEEQPSYAQRLREERARNRKLSVDRQQEIFDLCEQHRQIVATLEPMPRVIVQNEDGSVTRMDDNVRLEKLAESKAFIAENCVR